MLVKSGCPPASVVLGGVLGPGAGVAVGLQFQHHRVAGWRCPGRAAARGAPAPRCRAGPARGGRTRGPARTAAANSPLGAEPVGQLVVEGQVDVDLVVGRAVERPDAGVGRAAAGVDAPGRRRRSSAGLVLLAEALRQRGLPVGLDRVDVERVAAVELLEPVGLLAAHFCSRSRVVGRLRSPPSPPSGVARRSRRRRSTATSDGDDQADRCRRRCRDRDRDAAAADRRPPPPPPEPRRSSTWLVSSSAFSLSSIAASGRRGCRATASDRYPMILAGNRVAVRQRAAGYTWRTCCAAKTDPPAHRR